MIFGGWAGAPPFTSECGPVEDVKAKWSRDDVVADVDHHAPPSVLSDNRTENLLCQKCPFVRTPVCSQFLGGQFSQFWLSVDKSV